MAVATISDRTLRTVYDALSEPYASPGVTIVDNCVFLHPPAIETMERCRDRFGLNRTIPGLRWWMTKKPVHPDQDPYVIESCWQSEHDYWHWLRDNAPCFEDILFDLRREFDLVFWQPPVTRIYRLTHFAGSAAVAER